MAAANPPKMRVICNFVPVSKNFSNLAQNYLRVSLISRCFQRTQESLKARAFPHLDGLSSSRLLPSRLHFPGCNNSDKAHFSYSKLQSLRRLYKASSSLSIAFSRKYSTGDLDRKTQDPLISAQKQLFSLHEKIKKKLDTPVRSLQEVSQYYFDGQGKFIRPLVVHLMASACNKHNGQSGSCSSSQQTIVMVSEMIHTASLIHDDVIDGAHTRRSKTSVNKTFGDKACVLAGDYILSCASQALAELGNTQVVELLAQVVDDLIRGEFMQLGSKEDPDERFAHYLKKTYKKTASLIACCCKAVAITGVCTADVQETAFQYGKNIGIAFQLVDDALDFVASDQEMGKPTAADLSLGLATAPVLFACEEFPELNALIMRRFKEPGDVEKARKAVQASQGIKRTYSLAEQYTKQAVRQINNFSSSDERNALIRLTEKLLTRRK